MTEVPLVYFYATMVISEKAFKKIAPEDQKVVRSILEATFKEVDKLNRKDNEDAYKALTSQGIEFVTPTEADLKNWQTKAQNAIGDFVTMDGGVSRETMDTVLAILDEYRKQDAQ